MNEKKKLLGCVLSYIRYTELGVCGEEMDEELSILATVRLDVNVACSSPLVESIITHRVWHLGSVTLLCTCSIRAIVAQFSD